MIFVVKLLVKHDELYITWKSIIGTGCFIVETYKVSEEIIETELIKIWYTLL